LAASFISERHLLSGHGAISEPAGTSVPRVGMQG